MTKPKLTETEKEALLKERKKKKIIEKENDELVKRLFK